MKVAVGMTIIFGTIVMFMYNNVPRLVGDFWHAREFVPAQNFMITDYKCTNWNGIMFNECTTTFMSLQSAESRQFTDWRFGRAPRDPVRLLQWRDDASSVTTSVSLETWWNRLLLALGLILFGFFLMMSLAAAAARTGDAPTGARGEEPALQPTGRSTFGKRT
jgi:hypothetical protein